MTIENFSDKLNSHLEFLDKSKKIESQDIDKVLKFASENSERFPSNPAVGEGLNKLKDKILQHKGKLSDTSVANEVANKIQEFAENSLLPYEILEEIMKFADSETLTAMSEISEEFRISANNAPINRKIFDMNQKRIPIKHIFKFKTIDDVFKSTKDLGHKIEFLDLDGYKITNEELKAIVKNYPNIKHLNIKSCEITDSGLQHLVYLSNLESLNLARCYKITDTGLHHLVYLSNLKSLNLAECIEITDSGLQHLVYLSNLKSLNLFGCYKITDTGLQHLGSLSNLESLNLFGCIEITDAGSQYLWRDNKKLKYLILTPDNF